jgi:hypothetical protein
VSTELLFRLLLAFVAVALMLVLATGAATVTLLVRMTWPSVKANAGVMPTGGASTAGGALAIFNAHLARCSHCDLPQGRRGLCGVGAELYRRKELSEIR